MAAVFAQTPSLASATSTRVDSACKHIQQCRVSYDHMLDFVDSAHELEKDKMKYCVHKDEMAVGVARPWDKEATRQLSISAYPRIVSNMGDITNGPKHEPALRMIKYLYHFATSLQKRQRIIRQMNPVGQAENNVDGHAGLVRHYFEDEQGRRMALGKHMAKMYDYYPVGVANTLGYAHPNSGDTMSSVMIGGLRTIMNGDFEVYAGDQIQWYWTFERDCFRADGTRKAIADAAGNVFDGGDPAIDRLPLPHAEGDGNDPSDRARAAFNDLQYGATQNSRAPSDKAKHVARIKPYLRDDAQPRLYDWHRVFGIAISSARPNEMVDIKICRQSM
jgi:hypothetical protein